MTCVFLGKRKMCDQLGREIMSLEF